MGVSTRSHQVHTENFFKFDETFRVCRAFCTDHFGKKKFDFGLHLPCKICKIHFIIFVFFSKKICFLFKKLDNAL